MSKRLAVLIDGENISHRHYAQIREKLHNNGEFAVLRVFADWSIPNVSGWKSVASLHGIMAVHLFQIGKNSTDSLLIMDAIELLHEQPDIDTFCIISSDSDYCALCQRLRDRGKTVIGLGLETSSKALRDCCNTFHVIGGDKKMCANTVSLENGKGVLRSHGRQPKTPTERQISAICGG